MCVLLHLLAALPAQVLLSLMNDDTSDEDTRIAELSACRWPIPSLSDQASSPTASRLDADAPAALDQPIRTIEIGVRVHDQSLCFFDITSGQSIQELLEVCEDPGCSNETTCFRVSHITVHCTYYAYCIRLCTTTPRFHHPAVIR